MSARERSIRLHGVSVAAGDYGHVRTLAGVFFTLCDVQTDDAAAWRWAVLTAIRVLAEAREAAP